MCKKVHGVADTLKSNSALSKTINTNFQRFSLQFKEAVSRYSRHPFSCLQNLHFTWIHDSLAKSFL